MRAGPLSEPEIITILNDQFVNVWMLLRDVPEIQGGAQDASASTLATKLFEYYTYPVDSIILSPRLTFVDHQPANDLPFNKTEVYLSFLQNSLMKVHDTPLQTMS